MLKKILVGLMAVLLVLAIAFAMKDSHFDNNKLFVFEEDSSECIKQGMVLECGDNYMLVDTDEGHFILENFNPGTVLESVAKDSFVEFAFEKRVFSGDVKYLNGDSLYYVKLIPDRLTMDEIGVLKGRIVSVEDYAQVTDVERQNQYDLVTFKILRNKGLFITMQVSDQVLNEGDYVRIRHASNFTYDASTVNNISNIEKVVFAQVENGTVQDVELTATVISDNDNEVYCQLLNGEQVRLLKDNLEFKVNMELSSNEEISFVVANEYLKDEIRTFYRVCAIQRLNDLFENANDEEQSVIDEETLSEKDWETVGKVKEVLVENYSFVLESNRFSSIKVVVADDCQFLDIYGHPTARMISAGEKVNVRYKYVAVDENNESYLLATVISAV